MKTNTTSTPKTNIFKKAKTTYFSSLIQAQGTGKKREYLEIQDIDSNKKHDVTMEQTELGITFTCTCMHKSFHIDKPTLCSHIITAILYKAGQIKIK